MQRVPVSERRARIGARHGLAPHAHADGPATAAGMVVALHGTDAASVFLSALARTECDDGTATVEHALYEERSLLRVLAMRRTMFVAPVATAGVLLAACSRDVAARERRRLVAQLEAAGVAADADRWLTLAQDAALAALRAQGPATAVELAAADPRLATTLVLAPGKRYEARVSVASRLLTVLGAEGLVVRTRPTGGWTSTQFRWSALDDWHAGVPELASADARVQLARLWLAAFGPATAEDLRWWTGWTVTQTRQALAEVATEAVDLDGVEGMVLAGDLEPAEPQAPWVALVPALDATTMGWKQRDWYLGGHRDELFDGNGNACATVWQDGRIVGGWAQAPGGEIRVELLEDVGAAAAEAIEREADALAARVGDATISPRARARSAVERRLLG